MNRFSIFLRRLNEQFNRVTDWLLILLGMGMVGKAILAVDVPAAKYVIIGIGAALTGIGFWYRHRRKGRCR